LKALEDIWMAEQSWFASPNNAVWHCTQATEKIMKSFLRCLNTEYDYGHELKPLLDAVMSVTSVSEDFDKYVVYLSDFSSGLRYKNMSSDPSPEEARVAIARVKYILQELHNNSVCAKYMDEAKEVHKKILKSSFEKYSNIDINEDDVNG